MENEQELTNTTPKQLFCVRANYGAYAQSFVLGHYVGLGGLKNMTSLVPIHMKTFA